MRGQSRGGYDARLRRRRAQPRGTATTNEVTRVVYEALLGDNL